MNKTKALVLGIVCVAFGVAFVVAKDITGILAFSSGAVLFLGIWFYKYQRDHRIITHARQLKAKATQTSSHTP
jgi:hypothetical protein